MTKKKNVAAVITTVNTDLTNCVKSLEVVNGIIPRKIFIVGDVKIDGMDSMIRTNGARYYSVSAQLEYTSVNRRGPSLVSPGLMDYNNSYARKNIGYLLAFLEETPDYILDWDDDNMATVPIDEVEQSVIGFYSNKTADWFNYLQYFSDSACTAIPRGFPYQKRFVSLKYVLVKQDKQKEFGYLQGIANLQPDIYADERLITPRVEFNKVRYCVSLNGEPLSTLNSQNVLFSSKLLPALYLPVSVNDRLKDIYRGYIIQHICILHNLDRRYTGILADHLRNAHVMEQDLQMEEVLYDSVLPFNKVLSDLREDYRTEKEVSKNILEDTVKAYERLFENGFFEANSERQCLSAYHTDLCKIEAFVSI